ncbi:hypothetical protein AK830_g6274 [Neonectria ditissima]|uniref:Aminoglycoside phosphotransferase domain-containing protein n=1 Tax=Neonectria ditissima TaxID=78410 RepID=A0A0N8H6Y9_9HYPO|nr:hypothetical protein AK830_g6274 [Neonectria ditissima]
MQESEMNPYEADPDKIPSRDRYADVPFYGRYCPKPDDFHPDPPKPTKAGDATEYSPASAEPDFIEYWTSVVLTLCTPAVRIYENPDGGRDVFALGRIVVKSSHLQETLQGRRSTRDYSLADANEVAATALARKFLKDVKVPLIHFAGKIKGHPVFIQERIPGVGLNIAWQYISQSQKQDFKDQARQILRQLSQAKPPPEQDCPSYVIPDSDPVQHRGIQILEKNMLFSEDDQDGVFCLVHNDFTQSNTIVNDDKIVGLVDWEMAGFFGLKRAGQVHVDIRTPKRENFSALSLPEEFLQDILFWNDLYEFP